MLRLPKILILIPVFFFSFVFSLSAFFVFPSPTYALILEEENRTILEGGGPGFDDKAFNLNQLGGTIDSLNYFLSGYSQAHPELIAVSDGGAIGTMGNLISKLYQPPASSIQYLAYLKENLGLAGPAYAQQRGMGFQGLSYLLPIWQAFRNAAYLVFIIFFVITGLLIMFRVRVSPQAVATIQNMLPRLVITLILITLSYAIAGLMIDLMYVFIYLLLSLVGSSGAPLGNLGQFQNVNVFSYWSQVPELGWESISKPAPGIQQIVGQIVGDQFVLTGLLKLAAGGIALAVFTIAILWALFRLFFILLKAYVWILVLVIFAPFQLLLGALPGGGGALGISGWVRGLVANLAVFPTTIAMFSLASALIWFAKQTAGPAGNITDQWSAPLIGIGSIEAIQSLIALGIILLTPTVAQMMNDAFKPPPFPYGVAIGQALGGGGTAMLGAGRGVWGEYDRRKRLSLEQRRHEEILTAMGARPRGGP